VYKQSALNRLASIAGCNILCIILKDPCFQHYSETPNLDCASSGKVAEENTEGQEFRIMLSDLLCAASGGLGTPEPLHRADRPAVLPGSCPGSTARASTNREVSSSECSRVPAENGQGLKLNLERLLLIWKRHQGHLLP
jgi:hypothetical protein